MNSLYRETFGSGPPLVLVPGWAMHRRVWRPLALVLARDYRVTCIDLPGYGASPPWPGWTLADVTTELAQCVHEPAVWLGWSLGGQVVLDLVSRIPERVRKVVLVGTNPKFVAEGDWPGMEQSVFEGFVAEVKADTEVALNRFLGLICQGGPARRLRQLRELWGELPPPGREALLQGLVVLRDSDLRPGLSGLEVPVTVVAGEGDAVVPLEASRCLSRSIPCGRLVQVDKGGHVPFLGPSGPLVEVVRD